MAPDHRDAAHPGGSLPLLHRLQQHHRGGGGLGEGDQVLASCLVFNPRTESWAPLQSNLIKEKRGISLAVAGDMMWGAGGEDRNDQHLDMVMVYDNMKQAWVQGPSMRGGRAGHTVSVFFR